jgi:hypothetical protein
LPFGSAPVSWPVVPVLDALRLLTEFDPPSELPECDLAEVADVLEAHGLASLASYQVETRPIGAGLPEWFRERLLTLYQGIVNDNVLRLLTLRSLLKAVGSASGAGLPAIILDGAAYVDWLYPHHAFRPIGDLRLAVRADDGPAFAKAIAEDFQLERTGTGGHTAVFTNGTIGVEIQEGMTRGDADKSGLFDRRRPYPAFGPSSSRPSLEDALLVTVADQAELGLHAPLFTYVDVREMVRLAPDPALVQSLAERVGLSRALYGSLTLVAHYFPSVAESALALRPELGRAYRLAVDAVVESARDPAKLRLLRGSGAAARVALGV